MATFTKAEKFVEDLANSVHDLFGTQHTLNVYLTNAAFTAASHSVKADVAEISTGNGYTGPIDTQNDGTRSGGTVTVTGVSTRVTATGAVGPFRRVILYNDTPTSPADPIIGGWDYGSEVTLANGETLDIKFNNADVAAAGTILTIA